MVLIGYVEIYIQGWGGFPSPLEKNVKGHEEIKTGFQLGDIL